MPWATVADTTLGMAHVTEDAVRLALRGVLFPGFRRDIVTLGMIMDVRVGDQAVGVRVRPGTDKPEVLEQLVRAIRSTLEKDIGVRSVEVEFEGAATGRGKDPFAERSAIPGIRHVIAVSSAKGGVGKSTVAANLALALAEIGEGAGLLDADVYGPSVPILFGAGDVRPRVTPDKRIHPVVREGVKLMSIGFFLDEQSPVIWRGPIVMGIVRQFLRDVEWGETEFLVIDLPPGTGDAALTLVQQVPVDGGVVVTTPQDVALLDVARGIAMFAQVQTPVLGIVENMSGYVCPSCGTGDPIFGGGGAERLAARFGVPLLATLPIVPALRVAGDAGRPLVAADPDQHVSRQFRELARAVAARVRGAAANAASGAGS